MPKSRHVPNRRQLIFGTPFTFVLVTFSAVSQVFYGEWLAISIRKFRSLAHRSRAWSSGLTSDQMRVMVKSMGISGAGARIQAELSLWEGVSTAPHRFGGVEFKLANRELGHIHGDWLVDVPLPKPVRDELVASGEAEPHHVLPQSGWVSVHLNDPSDVDRALRVLRRSFELARAQSERRAARQASAGS